MATHEPELPVVGEFVAAEGDDQVSYDSVFTTTDSNNHEIALLGTGSRLLVYDFRPIAVVASVVTSDRPVEFDLNGVLWTIRGSDGEEPPALVPYAVSLTGIAEASIPPIPLESLPGHVRIVGDVAEIDGNYMVVPSAAPVEIGACEYLIGVSG